MTDQHGLSLIFLPLPSYLNHQRNICVYTTHKGACDIKTFSVVSYTNTSSLYLSPYLGTYFELESYLIPMTFTCVY